MAIVGARRAKQGTGPFMARDFARLGCDVRSFVGTSDASIDEARRQLARDYGLACRGYRELGALIAAERPDIVVICSPNALHRDHLEVALEGGAHVLCEKPLWWDDSLLEQGSSTLAALRRQVQRFRERGLLLELNTQWPCTLPAFYDLYPEMRGARVERFEMRLSPMSQGPIMVIDSAPHLLSMLRALLGSGALENVRSVRVQRSEAGLSLGFVCQTGGGDTEVELRLERCLEQPRPAWYAINGRRVARTLELPTYRMGFQAAARWIPIEDPLLLRIRDFVRCIQEQERTDCEGIVAEMAALATLVRSFMVAAQSSVAAKVRRDELNQQRPCN